MTTTQCSICIYWTSCQDQRCIMLIDISRINKACIIIIIIIRINPKTNLVPRALFAPKAREKHPGDEVALRRQSFSFFLSYLYLVKQNH